MVGVRDQLVSFNHIFTHRISSPLVTVLRRLVLNPAGSIPENPPILGPKKASNKSKGLVCKMEIRIIKSVINITLKQMTVSLPSVKYAIYKKG